MKRNHSIIIIAALCLGIWGGAQAGERVRVGFCVSTFNDTFISYIAQVAQRYAATQTDVDFEIADGQEDVLRQQDQVNTMLDSGLDALICLPIDTSSVSGIVDAAERAGVPLVFVNRNPFHGVEMPENIYYVGANTLMEGEVQMRTVVEMLGGTGKVAVISGTLSHEAAQNRTEGVERVAKEFPGIEIIAYDSGLWQRDLGLNISENFLTAYGEDLKAIVCNNDEMALGAALAVEQAGRPDIVVAGIDGTIDALQAISQGRLNCSIFQDSVAQGEGAIRLAIAAGRGEHIPEQIMLLPVNAIVKDNVEEFLSRVQH